jgi:hypothetical protein
VWYNVVSKCTSMFYSTHAEGQEKSLSARWYDIIFRTLLVAHDFFHSISGIQVLTFWAMVLCDV